MKVFKWWSAVCFIFIFGGFSVAHADTEIDGTAMTSSSFTFTGQVSISSLTANTLSVSTITAVSSATVTNETIENNLTIPNGVNATDAAAFGQIHLLQAPVYATSTTALTTSTTYFYPTSLTASITPTSTSSKILIMVNGVLWNGTALDASYASIQRAISGTTTNIGGTWGFSSSVASNTTNQATFPCSFSAIDSPLQQVRLPIL